MNDGLSVKSCHLSQNMKARVYVAAMVCLVHGCASGEQAPTENASRLPGFAQPSTSGSGFNQNQQTPADSPYQTPSTANTESNESQPANSQWVILESDDDTMNQAESEERVDESDDTDLIRNGSDEPEERSVGEQTPSPEPACNTACGQNAQCVNGQCECDAGFRMDGGACQPVDPCESVACSENQRCEAGQCTCRDGFVENGQGGCEAAPMSPLENRSAEEVCGRWNAFEAPAVSWVPTPGVDDPCDPGHVPADAQDAAIARVNLYRWLVGLPSVGLVDSILSAQQECAVVMDAINGLTHHPTPDQTCYTQGAAQGAGSSNLALGSSLVQSVDLFVGDRGVASLGHRRWVLNPGMLATAFGHKGRATCMYSFSMGGDARPDFIAWPPPGTVPTEAADGMGSVTLHTLRPGADFAIEAVVNGEVITVEAQRLPGNYGGGQTYSYRMPTGSGQNGASVTFTMRGLRDHEDVTWTTNWVRCR